MERRSFLRLLAMAGAALGWGPRWGLAQNQEPFPKFVDPPGEETAEITTAIDQVIQALKSGTSSSAILTDPKSMPLHPWPRFRQVIRDHATQGVLTLVTPEEPGTPLTLKGSVIDSRGNALAGVRVYAYHTSAKGWYSDRAAHVAASSGDQRHARLFGYLLCDEQGRFEVKTIRPAGYPQSDLPAHIHVEARPASGEVGVLVTEVQFSDDPRLTSAARERSNRERFVICDVQRGPGGEVVTAVLQTRG